MSDSAAQADTLGETLAATAAGLQNTPSQWKKTFEDNDDVDAKQPASPPPRLLSLCTFDEDETQIQFCSNVVSQELISPGRDSTKSALQLADTARGTQENNGEDDYVGDGESSNESEDFWGGGETTLDQRPLETRDDRKGPHNAHMVELHCLSSIRAEDKAPEKPDDEDDVETEMEDNGVKTPEVPSPDKPSSNTSTPSRVGPTDASASVETFYDKLYRASMAAGTLLDSHTPVAPPRRKLQTVEQTTSPPLADNKNERDRPIDPKEDEPTQALSRTSQAPATTIKRGSKRATAVAESSPTPAIDVGRKRVSKRPSYVESLDIDQTPRDTQTTLDASSQSSGGVRRRGSKRQQTESMDETCTQSPPKPRAGKKKTTDVAANSSSHDIRIVLTGLEPTESLLRKIESIHGAQFEADVTRGTHLVAPSNQLKRTVKMLCGISTCQHILDEKWLYASAKVGAPEDEAPFCLRDKAKEAQWQFDLRETMYSHTGAARRQFLQGRVFFVTPHKSVLPAADDLAKIIECAGGEVDAKGPRDANTIVITSTEALALKAVQRQLAKADPTRMYSPELILSGILKQSLDLAMHHVAAPGETPARSRRR
ncbi:Aste57867_20639 [Aphanomyces stellatus]|uniref:Aste57867_20639 protein n=1 Tax=Aphanomyces stellatus TaxID=120398 RepID=A0A485LFE6_9STRA|nr:hypothetical protein As57867_020571 [Aphanomyces stellatus]VFT97319.1 Aste57867_20639 [Aphanomyces stellatus]